MTEEKRGDKGIYPLRHKGTDGIIGLAKNDA